MVISKRHGIIILIVCLVLLVPDYQYVWSVRPGIQLHWISQISADYTAQEDQL